jgi:hypothetical protein
MLRATEVIRTEGRVRPTMSDRLRKLPEALVLTAGYYASRVPALSELIRRLD